MKKNNSIIVNGLTITLLDGNKITSVKLYENAGVLKEVVLKENRRLSGIYL